MNIPVLHIGDAIGRAVQGKGLKKVGLIGTRITMEDGFLKDWLRDHYRIETLMLERAEDRLELHRIIQKELGMGIFKPETKAYILAQIDKAFRIATPMRKASWTKRFAAGWGERRRASGDGGSGEGG